MKIINTRKYYITKEYRAGRIYSSRKAQAGRCQICGGFIDRVSLASLKGEDIPHELITYDWNTLEKIWILTPYCNGCMN